MEMPVPEGFGNSSLGVATDASRTTMYVVGTIAGAVAGFLIIFVATTLANAVDK
jgi:hypothetical protein